MSTQPRILLLDTASLYYRAFFGIPDTLKAPDGTVVNALRGLLDFVSTLKTAYEPDIIVACWDDAWRPTWRVELMPTYKTHRLADPDGDAEDTPELLSPQVPLIAEALDLVGIPVVGAPDCEADDVIGTIAQLWPGPVDVVTGDRDLFQLVDDARGVRILYTARGVNKLDKVDNDWIKAKYGINGSQYVDFAVMRGDPSDGIPGVAGIGDKTAATLIDSYGDLAGIQ
ncbi:MAG: 5'-3' exonuclease, partial [Aeromicrobium sp.]